MRRQAPLARARRSDLAAVARAGKRPHAPSRRRDTEVSAWPTEAWVEIDGTRGGRYVIGRTLVRIGREADNDICLLGEDRAPLSRRDPPHDGRRCHRSPTFGRRRQRRADQRRARRRRRGSTKGDIDQHRRGQTAASTPGPSSVTAQASRAVEAGNGMRLFRARIFGRFAMSEERGSVTEAKMTQQGAKPGRFLGSLKDALARGEPRRHAARRQAGAGAPQHATRLRPRPRPRSSRLPCRAEPDAQGRRRRRPPAPVSSAAEAAREVKGQTSLKPQDKHVEFGAPPTTRVVRGGRPQAARRHRRARSSCAARCR